MTRVPEGVAVPVPDRTKDVPAVDQADQTFKRVLERISDSTRPDPCPAVDPKPSEPKPQTISFDSKGVDFNAWLRLFISRVRRNWFVPLAAQNCHGHVVISFVVHRDGMITDIVVSEPSDVEVFNRAARNAIEASNPVEMLPKAYPDESTKFVVTFFYQGTPPAPATSPAETKPPVLPSPPAPARPPDR